MNPILAFYSHEGTDNKGRTLKQIWNFSDEQLEKTHDYVQWLFPTSEPSQFNLSAPILTAEDICEFAESDEMIANLTVSSFIFERFLKLDDITPFWTNKNGSRDDHNCLRISRVIESLSTLGLHQRAYDFYPEPVENPCL